MNDTRVERASHLPTQSSATRPHYGRVLLTFLRNSLIREMAFRGNFLIEVVTNAFWFGAQFVFFSLIFGRRARRERLEPRPNTSRSWPPA